MGQLGADVDQLDRLALSFDRSAARLENSISVIEGQIRMLWWSGSTADRYAASWAAVDRRHLITISARLREAAESVRLNAQQQRWASDGGRSVILPHIPNEWLADPGNRGAGNSEDGLSESLLFSAITVGGLFPGLPIIAIGVISIIGIAEGLHDLLTERRDDSLSWLESSADILRIGAGVAGLVLAGTLLAISLSVVTLGAAAIATAAAVVVVSLLALSVVIDVGIALYDNWEGIKDWAGDVWDDVADGASKLVSPVVDFVEGVVDVTDRVGEAIGDAVSDIAGVAEDVGSFITSPGRLIGELF